MEPVFMKGDTPEHVKAFREYKKEMKKGTI